MNSIGNIRPFRPFGGVPVFPGVPPLETRSRGNPVDNPASETPVLQEPTTPEATAPPPPRAYSLIQAFEFGHGIVSRSAAIASRINNLVKKIILDTSKVVKPPAALGVSGQVFQGGNLAVHLINLPLTLYRLTTRPANFYAAIKDRDLEFGVDQLFGTIGNFASLAELASSIGNGLKIFALVVEDKLFWLAPLSIVVTALNGFSAINAIRSTYLSYKVQKTFKERITAPNLLTSEEKLNAARDYLQELKGRKVNKYFKLDLNTIDNALKKIDEVAKTRIPTAEGGQDASADIREEALKLLSKRLKITLYSNACSSVFSTASTTLSALSFVSAPVMPYILIPIGLLNVGAGLAKHIADDHFRKSFATDLHKLAFVQV